MCNCISAVNEKLAEHNAELMLDLLNPVYCFVATEKVDTKKRGTTTYLRASFCPFCGEKYDQTAAVCTRRASLKEH